VGASAKRVSLESQLQFHLETEQELRVKLYAELELEMELGTNSGGIRYKPRRHKCLLHMHAVV
jgi:hypothetical protein